MKCLIGVIVLCMLWSSSSSAFFIVLGHAAHFAPRSRDGGACARRGESYPLGVSKLVHSFRLSVCLMFASDPKREAQNTDSCPPIILQVKSKEALNAVLAAQEGITYADADMIVSLGAVMVRKSQDKPWQRVKEHTVLEADSWLKFFPMPQRFPACHLAWRERVLHACDKYVIVDKPPCLPCQGVESNVVETAPSCAARALQLPSLILAHRLDACASGVLVLARTRAAQSLFTRLQAGHSAQGGVLKEYRAIVETPIPGHLLGREVTHYMAPESRGPALLRMQNVADGSWKKCVLKILGCTPTQVHPSHLTESRMAARGTESALHEVRIQLVTGRRHQIRAQLSALGAPIWMDSLYAPLAGLTLDVEGMPEDEADACMDRIEAATIAPEYPARIALQAMRVKLLDIDVSAHMPWWLRQRHDESVADASGANT